MSVTTALAPESTLALLLGSRPGSPGSSGRRQSLIKDRTNLFPGERWQPASICFRFFRDNGLCFLVPINHWLPPRRPVSIRRTEFLFPLRMRGRGRERPIWGAGGPCTKLQMERRWGSPVSVLFSCPNTVSFQGLASFITGSNQKAGPFHGVRDTLITGCQVLAPRGPGGSGTWDPEREDNGNSEAT